MKTFPTFKEIEKRRMLAPYYYKDSSKRLRVCEDMEKIWDGIRFMLLNAEPDIKAAVINAPCGAGKTTIQKVICKIARNNRMNAIIATNSNARLEDTVNESVLYNEAFHRTWVLNLSDNDTVTASEITSLPFCNLVATSTQRIISATDALLIPLYQMGKKSAGNYKDLLVIDEVIPDVEINTYRLSDVGSVVYKVRESISPADEKNDGMEAEEAFYYAKILSGIIEEEIRRITKIPLKEECNGKTHIDVFRSYRQIIYDYDVILLEIYTELVNMEKFLIAKKKIDPDSGRKTKLQEIITNSQKIVDNRYLLQIKTWIDKIYKFINSTVVKRHLSKEFDIDCFQKKVEEFERVAVQKLSPLELKRIWNKNKQSIRENTEGNETAMNVNQLIQIFDSENVVIFKTYSSGSDKFDSRPQIEIIIGRYLLDRLPWGKIPIVVLDGTADINPVYTDGRYNFKIVNDFNRVKIPVKIVHCNEAVSSYMLKKDNNADQFFGNMVDILRRHGILEKINPDKTLLTLPKFFADVACKKNLSPSCDRGKGEISLHKAATYKSADLTGSNDYREFTTIVKVGNSVISQITSFIQICCRNPEIFEELVKMDSVECQNLLRLVYTYNATNNNCVYYTRIRENQVRTAMVDVIQEFQRLRIRNRPMNGSIQELNKYAICVIWFMRGQRQGLIPPKEESVNEEIMRRVMEYFKVDIEGSYIYHDSVLNPYVKKHNVSAKIIEFYNNVAEGDEFTISDLAEYSGGSPQSVKKLIERKHEYMLKNVKKHGAGRRPTVYIKPASNIQMSLKDYQTEICDVGSEIKPPKLH